MSQLAPPTHNSRNLTLQAIHCTDSATCSDILFSRLIGHSRTNSLSLSFCFSVSVGSDLLVVPAYIRIIFEKQTRGPLPGCSGSRPARRPRVFGNTCRHTISDRAAYVCPGLGNPCTSPSRIILMQRDAA